MSYIIIFGDNQDEEKFLLSTHSLQLIATETEWINK